ACTVSGNSPGLNVLIQRMMPCLSTIKNARSGRPNSGLNTPYACDISPWGQKSETSGYEMPPSHLPHASFDAIGSQETAKTWLLSPSNSSRKASIEGIWRSQVAVNAKG